MDWDHPTLIPAFLLFLLWILVSSSHSAFPIAKEGCPDQCGDVKIPFPFGTKEGCYLQDDFLINCTNPGKPSLGNSLIETWSKKNNITHVDQIHVTDISADGQLHVLYPIAYYCSDPKDDNSYEYVAPKMSLPSPLAFNNMVNKFTVVGCNTFAYVYGNVLPEQEYDTGCLSVCHNMNNARGYCSGTGCCQTSIPPGASQINISVLNFDNVTVPWNDFNPCSYGFVVEESKFRFSSDNLTNINKNGSVPVVVDWIVEHNVTCEMAKANQSSYACASNNSKCVNGTLGYSCKCKDGFEGNPYLPSNGCRDIDECATLHPCKNHSTCHNTIGSYTCYCNQGYHKIDTDDICIANAPPQKKPFWIFAAIGSCTIVIVLAYFWYSGMMKMKENHLREEYFKKNGGFLLQEKLDESRRDASSYSVRIFTVEELQKSTNNFDDDKIIGQGGFGTVYKGELIDGTNVAIKKSRGVDQRGIEQFINEVILLSRINNRNVVKLLGCCLETEMPLLVYEFINNGTLFEHLKGTIRNQASKLSWNIRMQIASQVAGVLFYLHSYASPQIVHRDIKSSNILLDQDYMAKVADFGISKLISIDENQFSTMVQGTPGYLDPEYMHTGVLTEKSDVYSFGVVLIELLTGEKVFSLDRAEAERFLASFFLHELNNDNLLGVLDRNITYNIETLEQIKEVAMIAKRCVSVKGEDRPYMKEVLRELETLEIQTHKYAANVLGEVSKDKFEVFDEEQHSKARPSSDSYPNTFISYDLSSSTTTTIEHMLPVAGGR